MGAAQPPHTIGRKPFAPPMKLFAHTRTKRNTAFVVLLVWLFALASGIANACLLETPEPHSKPANGAAATLSQAPAEWGAHLGTRAGHNDDSDHTRESCLKVCDDGTNAVPKAYSGADHTGPGPATLVATLWTGSSHLVLVAHRLHDLANPIAGPPFRVRYSRLAL